MANRYSDWQEDLSKELVKSKKRRTMYFQALREEYGDDLAVLRVIIKIVGLKEYSKLCNIPSSNLSKYLKDGKDLKLSTIAKLLSPFSIKKVSIPIDLVA